MPRIYQSDDGALDFCKRCFPKEQVAEELYGDEEKTGSGPDNRGNCYGYNEDHPDYDDTDYKCHKCGKKLTDKDN